MNDSTLRKLLSRYLPSLGKERFSISSRIKDDRVFGSINESIDAINTIIDGKPVNEDNILPEYSKSSSYLLTINTIDEAICGILLEVMMQEYKEDHSFKDYIYTQLNELEEKLDYYIYNPEKSHFECCAQLQDIIVTIKIIYNKAEIKESKFITTQLAKLYYKLMLNMYFYIGDPCDEYRNEMINIYNSLIYDENCRVSYE